MTEPLQDPLGQLILELATRKAEFDETAADMGVRMPATIPIDDVLGMIAALRQVPVQPVHLFEVAVAADTPQEAEQMMSQIAAGQPLAWRRAGT